MQQKLEILQEKISYHFQNQDLLISAFTHSSYTNEKRLKKYQCNERLEFLGDAVLQLVSSEFLFFADSKMPEGKLSKLRASIVCEQSLAFCARELDLGSYLLLGRGEEVNGGRDKESVISERVCSQICFKWFRKQKTLLW